MDSFHARLRFSGVRMRNRSSAADLTFVSAGPPRLGESPLGFRAGMMLRDPDGHALERVSGS